MWGRCRRVCFGHRCGPYWAVAGCFCVVCCVEVASSVVNPWLYALLLWHDANFEGHGLRFRGLSTNPVACYFGEGKEKKRAGARRCAQLLRWSCSISYRNVRIPIGIQKGIKRNSVRSRNVQI